ncbi:(2Fe-2S)-binding protein [Afifella marina]|uniref:2Fe-2S iron-sulfur cluster binding domain-containing protein n=1 Tax=Afifella marina DSM 2698 TaxID=1120955 RepID=A0A1G5NVU0_AFIMA|nr:(2Fe-2S)-binding protein [Afifella marina]MBK1624101.1 hypothetical protein [Afifella marina DSM 2698]MBK1627658.1 hypothetical protein [Afifella marina]MBK5916382.1 hypothetical protein [Afifella marina]RAI20940.1 hypothetical protein CH311_08390 [Afifella marina DSM 2698]SCZ40901.1 2Fe-2S iron-sulfur cluster binding domain-containing protein [Afifella marina DSM 2698]
MDEQSLFLRVAEQDREIVPFFVNGRPATALSGDTVLTALLTHDHEVRLSEILEQPRAGFCLMGACQDCWIWTEDGKRVRACSTMIEPDMRLRTRSPFNGARPE